MPFNQTWATKPMLVKCPSSATLVQHLTSIGSVSPICLHAMPWACPPYPQPPHGLTESCRWNWLFALVSWHRDCNPDCTRISPGQTQMGVRGGAGGRSIIWHFALVSRYRDTINVPALSRADTDRSFFVCFGGGGGPNSPFLKLNSVKLNSLDLRWFHL